MAVPISSLARIVELTAHDIDEAGLKAGIVGHVGDGNFHSAYRIPGMSFGMSLGVSVADCCSFHHVSS